MGNWNLHLPIVVCINNIINHDIKEPSCVNIPLSTLAFFRQHWNKTVSLSTPWARQKMTSGPIMHSARTWTCIRCLLAQGLLPQLITVLLTKIIGFFFSVQNVLLGSFHLYNGKIIEKTHNSACSPIRLWAHAPFQELLHVKNKILINILFRLQFFLLRDSWYMHQIVRCTDTLRMFGTYFKLERTHMSQEFF